MTVKARLLACALLATLGTSLPTSTVAITSRDLASATSALNEFTALITPSCEASCSPFVAFTKGCKDEDCLCANSDDDGKNGIGCINCLVADASLDYNAHLHASNTYNAYANVCNTDLSGPDADVPAVFGHSPSSAAGGNPSPSA